MSVAKRLSYFVIAILLATFLFNHTIPSAYGESPLSELENAPSEATRGAGWTVVGSITKTFDIPPGEVYYVYVDNETATLREGDHDYLPEELPEAARDAVEMVPNWLKENLTRKFIELNDGHAAIYGNLIKGVTNPLHVDEVAFSIAHTSTAVLENGNVFPDVFKENARYIYENDQHLQYVNLTEVDDPEMGKYTTVIYTNGTGAQVQLPMEIYYWFIVHPKISDELPTFVNPDGVQGTAAEFRQPPTGVFWRDWLFNHNDTPGVFGGQNRTNPLLKDIMAGCTDYWQAVAAVSGWVVNSVTFTSNNERAVEPIRIYRKHIGRCGEHQDIACAAARASLIPTVCTSNMAEDHVWNEFWDGRWVHWDANSYNNVDRPHSQDKDYSGGKDISTIWSWRGDGLAWSVTEKYTPKCTFTATVQDAVGNPVDSADIWILTENYYDPQSFTYTTWGSTGSDGKAVFDLGNVRNYWSSAESVLGEDPPDQGGGEIILQIISGAQTDGTYSKTFTLPGSMSLPNFLSRPSDPSPEGHFRMDVDINVTKGIHSGHNILTGETYHTYDDTGRKIDFFMCDEANFEKYGSGELFDAYEDEDNACTREFSYTLPSDERWYAVLSNEDSVGTFKRVSLSIELYQRPDTFVTSFEEGAEIPVEDIITMSGTCAGPYELTNVEVSIDAGGWFEAEDTSGRADGAWARWEYLWNTSGEVMGFHNIKIKTTHSAGDYISQVNITLIDLTAPLISITAPLNNTEVKVGTSIEFAGTASDNVLINSLMVLISEHPEINITGDYDGREWNYVWDTAQSFPGTYSVDVNVRDSSGNVGMASISVHLLENVEPVLEITDPANNTVFPLDKDIVIEGTAADSSGIASLTVVMDGKLDEKRDISSTYTGEKWFLKLDPEDLDWEEGAHEIVILATDSAGNSGEADITVHIDTTLPSGTINTTGGETIFSDIEIITLTGIASDNYGVSGLELILDDYYTYDITPFLDGAGEWSYNYDPDNMSLKGLLTGVHTFKIRVVDSVDLENYTGSISIIIDGDKPSVTVEDIPQPIISGERIWVNGTASDDVKVSKIEFSAGGERMVDITSSFIDGSWSYLWDTTDQNDGQLNFTVQVTDIKGRIDSVIIAVEIITNRTDTDGDGMPDWWEILFDLDRESNDKFRDLDRDGIHNLDEYLGDDRIPWNDDWSDPTDKQDKPIKIKKSEQTGGNFGGSLLLIVLCVAAGSIVIVGVIIITVILIVKRQRKKKFEKRAYAMWKDPKLEAHKEKERFKYDDEPGSAGDRELPEKTEAGDVIVKEEVLTGGGSDEIKTAPAAVAVAPSTGVIIEQLKPLPEGPSEKMMGIPEHLRGTKKAQVCPTCPRCGTSSKYYGEHECYWCDTCQEYVREEGSDGPDSVIDTENGTAGAVEKPQGIPDPGKKKVVRRKVVKKAA